MQSYNFFKFFKVTKVIISNFKKFKKIIGLLSINYQMRQIKYHARPCTP